MQELKQFEYEGQYISFEFTKGSKMINATQMSKPFKGKMVGGFLRLQGTKDFITFLERRYADLHIADNQPTREVLKVIKGGLQHQGTWMDERLALKFAAWLSPEFEMWVYDRIYELLTTGQTQLRQTKTLPVIEALRVITDQLEAQAHLNTEVRQELDEVGDRLQTIEAKITSTDQNYFTIAGYCSLHRIPCPLDKAKLWGKKATTLSRQQTISTGTAHDERFGKVRTYHQTVLKQVIR